MNRFENMKQSNSIHNCIDNIHKCSSLLSKKQIHLMEVCGTHTMSVFRHGIKQILPSSIRLLAGPGCPVCVTPTNLVDVAILASKIPNVIITTFGDMMKVPGSESNLLKEKSNRGNIRIVYSPLDALKFARENITTEIIFLAVGFETTAPTVAATILQAEKEHISNFSLICSHKVMPPPMRALSESGEIRIDGFICPGHVSTITGAKIFEFLARDYHIPCVVSGFEPLDILQSIEMLLQQIISQRSEVEIQYRCCTTWHGNLKAQSVLTKVFEPCDSEWRGLGNISNSGLKLNKNYRQYDALIKFNLHMPKPVHIQGCICGEILRGVKEPVDCCFFRSACSPETPIGPCMVSNEGACAAYYKYEKHYDKKVYV